VWIDTLSESFNIPTGKFAALANPDDGNIVNPIITNTGKAFSVRLIIDSLVSTFELGLDAGSTELATADGKKHIVHVGVTKTAGAPVGGAGNLVIVTDVDTLGIVTDNQLHMLVKYDPAKDVTQLSLKYDTNSAVGTTAQSDVIEIDFMGDLTANLTPAALNFI
jgi:hypothetical protein